MEVIVIQRKHTHKKKRKLCLSTKTRVDKATEKCLRIAAWWRTLNTAHAAEAARKQKDEVRGREKSDRFFFFRLMCVASVSITSELLRSGMRKKKKK